MSKAPVRLNLKSREAFASLTLHEKNTYLQEVADNYAAKTDREKVTLDKDALSRLRRYYSRRVWADLKLPEDPTDPLQIALKNLGESMRLSHVEEDISGALMASLPGRKMLRTPPPGDEQLSFFVPAIYDAPIKDDVNLMDVAPFVLSTRARSGVIQYELKDCLITVEGGAQSGMATIFDYDIFLNMVSYLAEEVRRYRAEEAKGQRPTLPAKVFRPSTSQILKFCRRSPGGKAYVAIEAALDRLTKTTIKIVNLSGGTRRQVDSRPLIGGYEVLTKTASGYPDQIAITIPDWIWASVVRPDKSLSILTLNPDYFLISSAIGRFLYRLARKAAGKKEAHYKVSDLHHRSGSVQEIRFFSRDLRRFVATTKLFPLPDYDLSLTEGREEMILHMVRRDETMALPSMKVPVIDG